MHCPHAFGAVLAELPLIVLTVHFANCHTTSAGVTALYAAMHCPHVFGAVLAESPSLWIAKGRFLEQDLKAYRGPLPERIFIGCGELESMSLHLLGWSE